MYSDCDCADNKYNFTADDCDWYNYNNNEKAVQDMKKGEVFCASNEKGQGHRWTCNTNHGIMATTDGTGCLFKSDGVKRYIGCRCKRKADNGSFDNHCGNCSGSGDTDCWEIRSNGVQTCTSRNCD